jgi:hypothetical protein
LRGRSVVLGCLGVSVGGVAGLQALSQHDLQRGRDRDRHQGAHQTQGGAADQAGGTTVTDPHIWLALTLEFAHAVPSATPPRWPDYRPAPGPGQAVTVTIARDAQTLTGQVTLGELSGG